METPIRNKDKLGYAIKYINEPREEICVKAVKKEEIDPKLFKFIIDEITKEYKNKK